MYDTFDYQLLVPRNIEECRAESAVSAILKRWAKLVQTIGMVLFVISVVGGLIAAIGVSVDFGEFGIFFAIFASALVGGGIVFGLAKITSIMLLALASVVYNTTVTARVSMLKGSRVLGECESPASVNHVVQQPVYDQPRSQTTHAEPAQANPAAAPKSGWKCSCGHSNSAVKTVCSRCGKAKE